MSNVPSEQKIWQTTIVTLGLQHKFLLRGILALSALHLAYLKPGPASIDYMVKASTHQNIGLSNFRKALQKINAETFDAILAFSCLLPIHSITIAAFFTSGPTIPEQEQDVIAAFLGALSLLRSVNSLLLPSLDIYTSSTITPLLQVTTQKLPEQPMTYPGLESLQRLEIACSVFSTSTSLSTAYAEREVFIEAIALLRSTFATTVDTESTDRFTIGAELIWTITISDEYFGLLGRGHPSALAILAHFAVLLHRHDNVWWLQGLGKGVIERVAEVLGAEWAEVVRWPRIAAGLTT
ncbi:hypothetical protein B0O99DRAFT_64472 [Bisporella sp. PMI_857]|nr:hypothetical protein B0O99DRAFT_64472 [Bisporella sp. PMI_857]